MQHLEGSGTPVLYIGPRFLKVNVVTLRELQTQISFYCVVFPIYQTEKKSLQRVKSWLADIDSFRKQNTLLRSERHIDRATSYFNDFRCRKCMVM